MSKVRYDFAGELVCLSPVHVGTGETRHVATVTGSPGDNTAPEVAAIARDEEQRAYIPPTTLKGLLRRLGEKRLGQDLVAQLFGEIKDDDETGRQGAITVRGARLVSAAPQLSLAPYAQGNASFEAGGLGVGVFVAARTAIDAASGTAADHRLFFQEMVAPGARFSFWVTVTARGREAKNTAIEWARSLATLLRDLTASDGHTIGKGQADGLGRMQLDPRTVTVKMRAIGPDGSFDAKPAIEIWNPARVNERSGGQTVDLICPGPFLVIDSSRGERASPGAIENDEHRISISAQKLVADAPLLLGTSIAGALRARAAWLSVISGGAGDDQTKIVRETSEISDLTPVQRLFGVTGFRGLLTMRAIEVSGARIGSIASVRLDRFSGAPVDNALFRTEAFFGTRLRLVLDLDLRSGKGAIEEADVKLFDALLTSIREDGIELGHGTSKGFGWFQPFQEARNVQP